jgi:nucleoside-diphosphate-sugar epimerase
MKIAVFGASGFVGTTLIERLRADHMAESQAFIRGFGSAWRLARTGSPLRTVDITSASAVAEALNGYTHVVNCTRGDSTVMLTGLANLLAACKANKVKRFVHLSSVAVYGDPPPAAAAHEDAPTNPAKGSYGAEKLRQDEMVEEAAKNGLDCVVLCPPNISGVYSGFVSNVLADMRRGSFALLDGGSHPNNVVDVDNLAHAIILSLKIAKGDGKRIFVTDGAGLTWRDLSDALMPLAELSAPVPSISAADLVVPQPPPARPATLWRSLKHLVSSDVREALRRDPLLAKFDMRMRRLAALGGKGMEDRLRESIEGPLKVAKVHSVNRYSSRYVPMQTRDVWHKIDRAREVLGYEPLFSFAESMARFQVWYRTMHGFGESYWPLVRLLDEI